MMTCLPDAADPDRLTDALRRHGVMSAGRVRDVTADTPRDTRVASAAPVSAQKAGGTLRVTHRDTPPSASIHEEATISTVMPFMSIYNNLVVFDPQSKQNAPDHIVPDLATEWAWSDDGTRLTFKLRDGVKWHDGKPFTSADVKCTWDMLISPESKLRKNPRVMGCPMPCRSSQSASSAAT